MGRIRKSNNESFFKIVLLGSNTFEKLNQPQPFYGDDKVEVISITPVGTDKVGVPLFCYELKFKENN